MSVTRHSIASGMRRFASSHTSTWTRRVSPRSAAPGVLETWRAAAALSRDLRPWLRGRVRYSFAQQHASSGLSVSDFDRNRVEMSLSAVYQ